jgi:hypothetical protein
MKLNLIIGAIGAIILIVIVSSVMQHAPVFTLSGAGGAGAGGATAEGATAGGATAAA